MLTCAAQIFAGPLVRMAYYWHYKRTFTAKAEVCHTQRDLNALCLGPPFLMSVRYAEILSSIFVIFMYSAGMPILYLIGCAQMFVAYWVDKFLFLRRYRNPPRFDEKIGRRASGLIPYAVILHLVMALWMYGNDAIFVSDQIFKDLHGDGIHPTAAKVTNYLKDQSSVTAHLTKQHVIPITILLSVMVLRKLLSLLKFSLGGLLARCMNCVACCTSRDFESELRDIRRLNKRPVKYSEALRHDRAAVRSGRRVIMGLPTYDIMENPEYREAFGVSDSEFERVVADGGETYGIERIGAAASPR